MALFHPMGFSDNFFSDPAFPAPPFRGPGSDPFFGPGAPFSVATADPFRPTRVSTDNRGGKINGFETVNDNSDSYEIQVKILQITLNTSSGYKIDHEL